MKSKKKAIISLLLIFSFLFSSCGNKGNGEIAQEPKTSADNNIIIGDLAEDGIQIKIPPGAIPEDAEFTYKLAEDSPESDPARGKILGTPFDINIDGEIKRFNEPVSITFKLTEEEWNLFPNPGEIHIAYFDGYKWIFLESSNFDTEEKSVTYQTYHCSLIRPSKPEESEMKKQIAHKMAVESVTVDKNAELRKTTESLVKSVMGPNVSKSLLQDIVEGIMDQNDYTQLAKAAATGNQQELETQFLSVYTQVTANTLWAYASNYADNLGDLGANLGLASAFGTSTAYIANGDYQAAAEELARGIIQTHPIGKLFMTSVNVTERQIARWKSQEIEAAYQIYLNGKEPTIPFWGYGSIPAGDFDEIWNQMRGVGRQIIIDAVNDFKKENGREPSPEEKTRIENDAKKTLESEFKERKEREEDIAEAEKKNMEFLEILDSGNLLTRDRYGYDPEKMTYKDRVKQLLELRNKVLIDTKRNMNFAGEDTEKEINAYTVSRLISVYVSQGEEAYNELLISEGFVEGFDLKKAAGTYTTKLQFSKKEISNTESPQKEVSISNKVNLKEPLMEITLDKDGNLSLAYNVEIFSTRDQVVTYPNGQKNTSNAQGNYLIEDSFSNIIINTAPGSVTNKNNIIGDRYYSGKETYLEGKNTREIDISRFYVSSYLENINAKIQGSKIIITGKINFEIPISFVGSIDQKIPTTFQLEISSKK